MCSWRGPSLIPSCEGRPREDLPRRKEQITGSFTQFVDGTEQLRKETDDEVGEVEKFLPERTAIYFLSFSKSL